MANDITTQPENRQLTAVQRAQMQRDHVRGQMITALDNTRQEIEPFLKPLGVDFGFFRSAAQIGLNKLMATDSDFFSKVRVESFIREVIVAARLGLVPDGKKCAIVRYAEDCSCLPMVEGYVDVLGRTGLIKDINHNVVIKGDDFDFEEGTNAFVKHKPSLERDSNGEAIGAWCVVTTTQGGYYQEVVNKKDLERIAATSKSQNGPRAKWGGEMHRKAPFRRIVKRLSKEHTQLQLLSDVDDKNYTLEPTRGGAPTGPVPRASLFSDTRHKPAPAEEDVDQTAGPEDTGDQRAPAEQRKARAPAKAKPAPKPKASTKAFKKEKKAAPAPAKTQDDPALDQGQGQEDMDQGRDQTQDEWDGKPDGRDDTDILASLRNAMNNADDHPALLEIGDSIFAGERWEGFRENTQRWLKRVAANRAAQLSALQATAGKLRFWAAGGDTEPKVYEDAKLWSGDILAKMSSIKGDKEKLSAFWAKNSAFVKEAIAIDKTEAARVLAVAAGHGLERGEA